MDINADVGEGCGYDAALMPFIRSANVAAAYHAGSPDILRATIQLSKRHGVNVGAHPGFRDPRNFGRRELGVTPAEVEVLLRDQWQIVTDAAKAESVRMRHVKPHGGLYNMAARDRAPADAVVRAVGSLVARSTPGAVIDDESVVVARAVLMATKGTVSAIDGSELLLKAGTICVHGDTPGCDRLARRIPEALG